TKCANEYQGRNKIAIKCQECGITFKVSPSRMKFDNPTFCSLECNYKNPERIARLISLNADQMKNSPNKLEMKGYNLLQEMNIEFKPQYIINKKFTVDAFLPKQNAVIQFDGDYWHGNPNAFDKLDHRQKKRKALDKSQD